MPVRPAELTATFEAQAGAPTASFAPGGPLAGSGFDEELRRLLRARLILVHVLGVAYIALLAALSVLLPEGEGESSRPDQGNPWRLVPPIVQSLVGAVVLWRSPRMSLRSLRLWELVYFATHAAYFGWLRFEMLAYAAAGRPTGTTIGVGAAGGFSLFGLTLMLAYGVLIPNTRRRSLLVVAGLTAVPFITLGPRRRSTRP